MKDKINKIRESLVSDKELNKISRKRKKSHLFESIPKELKDNYIKDGWESHKDYKHKSRVKKPKPTDMAFEDQVWSVIQKLGFTEMSPDRNFTLPYSFDPYLTQQIDVFAADEATALIIECKSTSGEIKKGNFKTAIEAIGGKKEGLIKTIQQLYPNTKHKVKFIFATKNYILSDVDKERLDKYNILHFDDETIRYYEDLTKHLGLSARFQLLGNLFVGQTIPEIQNKIPAIEGKMGGHTYYSFSIEPEKLLKIGYVLHRNKANKKLMPTYQRLIKRSRLRSVEGFVNDGGFFPNSIIINIETKKNRRLQFDKSDTQVEDSLSRIGVLHLPKKYRSAYIIDGQHRLYGYANSDYKKTNSIPVVAFLNLKRSEQVKIFMDINEKQKAVPKNLRNTLKPDLLWDSDNLNERITALKLQIAQDLGEDPASPLFDRIQIGENPKTQLRCITIESIKNGLDRGNFFGKFSKDTITEDGTFYKGGNDETLKLLFPFICKCFDVIKTGLLQEWNKGEGQDGFIAINNGVESFLRLFSDIIDHLIKQKGINPKSDSIDSIINEMNYYLDPLLEYLEELKSEKKLELKKQYGTGGKVKYWRTLQQAINDKREEFIPPGLEEYWRDEDKRYNEESFKMIRDIEGFMKKDFRMRLSEKHGQNWFKDGIPKKVYDDSSSRASDKNYTKATKEEEVEPWDCLNIIDYRKIATYGSNWSEIFEKLYTKPGEEKMRGGKEAKTKWMQKLERIRNENMHSYSVKESEYHFLLELNDWLIDR